MADKKIAKIIKCYKNTDLLFDIYLENYHSFNIYIRLDYYKKQKVYRLSWVDLAHINNDPSNVISYEYLPDSVVTDLEKIIKDIKIKKYEKIDSDEFKVTINNNLTDNKFSITFNRYIPKDLLPLFNAINIIFESLPRKLNPFYEELGAAIVGNTSRFEYQESFHFDLFKDDLDSLFYSDICERGQKYYNEGRVFFLEKVKDQYFAVVGGSSLYVVIIKYDEVENLMQMYCSCPCEFYCKHMYAVLYAIRNKKFRNFYKITLKNNHIDLLDRIMNFNFLLTIGIDDAGKNYLIIENGLIKLLPIINDKGKSEWAILEDDSENTLTNRLNKILK